MSAWDTLLEQPNSRGHYVQVYEADEPALTTNVGRYLWEGLRRGEGVLVIATPKHQQMFCGHLDRVGADLPALLASQQLVLWDAQHTLTQCLIAGQPDWKRFESVIRAAMRQVHAANGGECLRAFGEMAGLLWKAHQFDAAVRLERVWNQLLEQSNFSLYCAYAIDVFGEEFADANLDGVLSMHTHLIPGQSNGTLETALNRSIDEILGGDAESLRILVRANYRSGWAVIPTAETILLWLRKNLPGRADEIVSRARQHYQMLMLGGAAIVGK